MQHKVNLTGVAALITSIAAAAGVLVGLVQASSQRAQTNQTQEQSYAVIKESLEKFSGDVSDDLDAMKAQIHRLEIEVAVLKDRTRRAPASAIEPPKPVSRRLELKSYGEIQESAAASLAESK
jgi:hypothetical protein